MEVKGDVSTWRVRRMEESGAKCRRRETSRKKRYGRALEALNQKVAAALIDR